MKKLNRTLLISSVSVAFVIIAIIASLLFTNIVPNKAFETTTSLTAAISIISVIISLALGTFQVFDKAKDVHTNKLEEKKSPLKITLEIDGEPITVETSDVKRAAEILKLVQDLQTKQSSNN